MFVDRSVPRISQTGERFAFVSSMKERLTGLIQQAVDAGQLAAGHRPAHGVPHSQHRDDGRRGRPALCNRLAPGEDADALARDTLEAALTGLRAGIPLTFSVRQTCGDSSARS